VYRALRPGGLFTFPIGLPAPHTSVLQWATRGFDLVMRVRNALWRPPFVMYYRTSPLSAVRDDLTAAGFTVTAPALTALGRRRDGGPRCRIVLARKPAKRLAGNTLWVWFARLSVAARVSRQGMSQCTSCLRRSLTYDHLSPQ
jgi:hypothetical protein